MYDYDASLQRVKADTASGHVEYVLDGTYVLRESGARTRRYHSGEGKGLSVDDGGGARWLSLDGLGSTSAEVTPGGSVTRTVVSDDLHRLDGWRSAVTFAGSSRGCSPANR